jgi:ureidoacrylate peracid hydrolase
MTASGREVPIDRAHAALLIIDMQNFCVDPAGGWWRDRRPTDYFVASLRDRVSPNIFRLQAACRRARIELLYSVIENLTRNGRDRSLDYRISGIDVAPGSRDAQVLDALAPAKDEMIFRKTSSNVFVSTNLDYVLRNLGTRSLIVAGIMTDQCVESAVRDACDLGYLVTLVADACTTESALRHEQSLRGIRGYCRQRPTDRRGHCRNRERPSPGRPVRIGGLTGRTLPSNPARQ